MPLFMDRHDVPGITAEQVAQAHMLDLAVSAKYGVQFLSYWFDADAGAAFCLAKAPSACRAGGGPPRDPRADPERDHPGRRGQRPALPRKDRGACRRHRSTSPFRTIVFTDLKGSTSLLNEVGQSAYMVLLTEHDLIIRRALVASHGREVKHTGDGIMASFDDVARALACATAIEDGFDERNATSEGPALLVRIGMAAGEPVDRGNDLFGSTVTLASRICDAADGGQVLVSEVVHDLGSTKGYRFAEAAPRILKGFSDLTALFELERDRTR